MMVINSSAVEESTPIHKLVTMDLSPNVVAPIQVFTALWQWYKYTAHILMLYLYTLSQCQHIQWLRFILLIEMNNHFQLRAKVNHFL